MNDLSTTADWFMESMLIELNNDLLIPKVQNERQFGWMLSLFIEDLLQVYGIEEGILGGKLRLIGKEFPLKKEGENEFHSINVDYLFANEETVFLVEFKTSVGSFKQEQLEGYVKRIQRIEEEGTAFLLDEIRLISRINPDYEGYLHQIISNLPENFNTIRKAEIFYIAPYRMKKLVGNHRFLDLHDLADIKLDNTLKGSCWKMISESFGGLNR
jgi:hypothetical protein